MLTRISIKVIPNAKVDQVVGLMGDGTLKIRVKAKPVEGKANAELLKFLSKKLGIRKSELKIIAGEKNRVKTIEILGVSKEQILSVLLDSYEDP